MMSWFHRLFLLALIGCFAIAPGWMVPNWQMGFGDHVGIALADDEDDDDDDDDEDDDDDDSSSDHSGSSGGQESRDERSDSSDDSGWTRPARPRAPQPSRSEPSRPAPQAPRPAIALPDNAPNEIVTLGLSADDLDILIAEQFEIISERAFEGLELTSLRLRIPPGISLSDARERVRALPSGGDADFNHFYRTNQGTPEMTEASCSGMHCTAWQLVNWSPAEQCGAGVRLGMVDTRLNEEHLTFTEAALSVERFTDDGLDRSRAIHGTAVAALLIGDPQSRSPGLVPAADLVAVDVFSRAGGDERADVFSLVNGLAHLAEQQVGVINLSLAGPHNAILEAMVRELVEERGVVLVAAAGNAGPRSEPLYPAAYEPVIAVTAVTVGTRVYRRAVQGPHIDLAAPGVEVWSAASISGARAHTGTSFAAPFVTAAAALMLADDPAMTPQEVRAALTASAEDLGSPGRDDVFGYGLVDSGLSCRPGMSATP